MSDYKTHIYGGIIFSIVIVVLIYLGKRIDLLAFMYKLKNPIIVIPSLILGSILPDIDHPMGKVTGWFYTLSTLFIVIGYVSIKTTYLNVDNLLLLGIIMLVFTLLCAHLTPHRGNFLNRKSMPKVHSFTFGAIFAVIALLLVSWVSGLFILIGYISHLIMDGEVNLW